MTVDSLVLGNLKARPTRALTSMSGIAIGVLLIVVTVGLARGMLHSTGERESNVGAEILFQAPGGFGAGVATAPLSLPVVYARALAQIQGVEATTPVGRYVRSGAAGLGFELIEGVLFAPTPDGSSYTEITGIEIQKGKMPSPGYELIVDHQRAADQGTTIGSTVKLLGREFTVVGIFAPEVGARVKMSLQTMQELLGTEGKCSWVLVKTETPAAQEAIAERIEARFPGNQIIYTRDIPGFYEKGLPSLTVFLNVVVGLSVVISALIVLLAMATAVTERTREIGILKSLGASKPFIVTVIQKEALLLSFLGVVLGFVLAIFTKAAITELTSLVVMFELKWIGIAALVAIAGGALGALYPALRAAKQDPVRALAYE